MFWDKTAHLSGWKMRSIKQERVGESPRQQIVFKLEDGWDLQPGGWREVVPRGPHGGTLSCDWRKEGSERKPARPQLAES